MRFAFLVVSWPIDGMLYYVSILVACAMDLYYDATSFQDLTTQLLIVTTAREMSISTGQEPRLIPVPR